MNLKQQIEADIKKAMLEKRKEDLTALRAIKSSILLAETEKGAATALTEEAEIALLSKAAKQRRDSAAVFNEQGRTDLAEKELAELKVIEVYLPKQLSDGELSAAVTAIISSSGASSMKDMGKVMGMASKELAGKADGKAIAQKVKELLS